MVFGYTEKNLNSISEYVISTCFKAMDDFPNMFNDDPMINFETPQQIGFGITRGPSCCLFSGKQVIDYSGQLLNLAARLNDLARPKGIVIDGNYLQGVIPGIYRPKFKDCEVFVRSIAEENPIKVYYNTEVSIPSYALFPMKSYNWISEEKTLTVSELFKISGTFTFNLKNAVMSPDKIKFEHIWPHKSLKNYTTTLTCSNFSYIDDAKGPRIILSVTDINGIKSRATSEKYSQKTKVNLLVQYVPKLDV